MTDPVVKIYLHEMPSAAWQLLWWLILKMDKETKQVRGGWRERAAKELKRDRVWMGRCAQHLQERNLITTEPRARWVQVNTERLVG